MRNHYYSTGKASYIRTETSHRIPHSKPKRIRHKRNKISANSYKDDVNINTTHSFIVLIIYIYLFALLIAGIVALIH
jgi:hypothetical protein